MAAPTIVLSSPMMSTTAMISISVNPSVALPRAAPCMPFPS
jgi:hypothetical protein